MFQTSSFLCIMLIVPVSWQKFKNVNWIFKTSRILEIFDWHLSQVRVIKRTQQMSHSGRLSPSVFTENQFLR